MNAAPRTEIPACAVELAQTMSAQLQRPVLIGIGGPGGSGKSSFARVLAQHLDDAQLLPLDDYRKPRNERPPGIFASHPAGNRLDLLRNHLALARSGQPFERPVFCRTRGGAFETETVAPGRFLVLLS